jgi:hypothetical protein
MLKIKTVTEKGEKFLEIKKDKYNFAFGFDILPELYKFLTVGEGEETIEFDGVTMTLTTEGLTIISGENEVPFTSKELFELTDCIGKLLNTAGLQPIASTIPEPIPATIPIPAPKQDSKLAVIELALVPIEWQAWATCPKCKSKYLLETQISPHNSSQIATQCPCGQLMILQK